MFVTSLQYICDVVAMFVMSLRYVCDVTAMPETGEDFKIGHKIYLNYNFLLR